ncbi:ABC transporter substrate-binding protein [bacterium]|nr:ABC transporter substrate-binding protein [bacterium]
MYRRYPMLFLLLTILLVGFSACDDEDDPKEERSTIQIGALIPTSGDYGIQGMNNLAALEQAVLDINSERSAQGSSIRFELVSANTSTDPEEARSQLVSMLSQGLRGIVGPLTSAELLNTRDAINASTSILISPSSTITELAVAGDNIYRAVTSDEVLVQALLEVMALDGIEQVATIYREDSWGESINALLATQASTAGVDYLGGASYYAYRNSLFIEACDSVEAMVQPLIEGGSSESIAVVLVCFDEGTPILRVASNYTTSLGILRWYGSDGFANNGYLVGTDSVSTTASFAASVQFTAPVFGVVENERYLSLAQQIEVETGNTPGIYPIVTYDSFMLLANTLAEVGEAASLNVFKERLVLNASEYDAITGDMMLDENGDRAEGDYYFWTVMENGGSYSWEHTRTRHADGTITDE